jgi:hypothetical protein
MHRYDRIKFHAGLDVDAYEVRDLASSDVVDIVNIDGSPLTLPTEYAYHLVQLGEKVE